MRIWVFWVAIAALVAVTSCGGAAYEARTRNATAKPESCSDSGFDGGVSSTQVPITVDTIEVPGAESPVAVAGRRNGGGFFLVEATPSDELRLRQVDAAGGTEDVTSLGTAASAVSGPDVLEDDEGRPVVLWPAEGPDGSGPILTLSRIDTAGRVAHTEVTALSGDFPWLYQLRPGRVAALVASDGAPDIVRVFDFSGLQVWEAPLGSEQPAVRQLVGSGDMTIVRSDRTLLAWDSEGELLWEQTLPQSWRTVVEMGGSSATDTMPAVSVAGVLGDGRSLCLLSDDGVPVGSLQVDTALDDFGAYQLGSSIVVLNTVMATRGFQDLIVVDLDEQSAAKMDPGGLFPGADPFVVDEAVLEDGGLVVAGRTIQANALGAPSEVFISVLRP